MGSSRSVPTAIIGLLAVVVTLLLFFTAVTERHAVQWVGISFIILAEIITTAGFIAVDEYARSTSGVFLRAGSNSLLIIYLIITAAVSIFFISGYYGKLKWLVTIDLAVIAVCAAIMVPIFMSSRSLDVENTAVQSSTAMMKQLWNAVMMLRNDVKNSRYSAQLDKVYDAVRYSDYSISVPPDLQIAAKIKELEQVLGAEEEAKDEQVEAITNEILMLAKKRASEASALKSGAI